MLFSILMLLSCGKLISSPIRYIWSDNSGIHITSDDQEYNCTSGNFDLSKDFSKDFKASINLSNCKLVKDKPRSIHRPSHYNADGVKELYNVEIDPTDNTNTQVNLSFEGKKELTLKCPKDVSSFVDQYKPVTPVTAQMPNIMTDIYPNNDIWLTLTAGGEDGRKFVARCCLGCSEQEFEGSHEIHSGLKPVRNKDGEIIGFAPYGADEAVTEALKPKATTKKP
jgi:hypothetical protein